MKREFFIPSKYTRSEDMNKKKKFFGILGFWVSIAVAVPAAFHKLIFLLANRKSHEAQPYELFDWKEGRVAYHTYGTGRPLLLLHHTSVGASHAEWEKNIDFLAQNHKVYAIDLPGFGASEKPKITYTAYQYALFLNDFIEQQVKRPVSIVASSASADFALMAYLMKPKNMRKLVLISPTGMKTGFAIPEDNKKRRMLQAPLFGTQYFIQAASKKAIKEQLEKDLFFSKENVPQKLVDTYYIAAHKGGENARFSYASTASGFTGVTIKKALENLKIPFLVAWGEENRSNPAKYMDQIEELRPDGEYAIFEKTRLLPHYENSVEFNQLVKEFLN